MYQAFIARASSSSDSSAFKHIQPTYTPHWAKICIQVSRGDKRTFPFSCVQVASSLYNVPNPSRCNVTVSSWSCRRIVARICNQTLTFVRIEHHSRHRQIDSQNAKLWRRVEFSGNGCAYIGHTHTPNSQRVIHTVSEIGKWANKRRT